MKNTPLNPAGCKRELLIGRVWRLPARELIACLFFSGFVRFNRLIFSVGHHAADAH